MKRNIIFMLLLLLLFSCSSKEEDAVTSVTYNYKKESEPIAYVDVLEATKSNLIPLINASGIIKGKNESLVLSETQGIIEQVFFSIGDIVNEGTILLKVDDTIAGYNKDHIKLELETAKLELDAAQKSYKSGNLSLLEFKRTENRYYAQKVRYEQAIKAWRDCSVRAPISGIIANKDAQIAKGNFIVPGTPVAGIVNSEYYTVSIALGERQIGFIKKGQKALVRIPAATDETIEAEVSAVAGGSNEQTGSFTAIIAWENKLGTKVKSGMSANIQINITSQVSHIIIPLFSIVKKPEGEFVFIVKDNRAVLRKIISGEKFGERAEVIDGLSEGDTIIITRISTLVPDERVSPRNVGKSGEWQ
ncbi:MAG: efflux RND transporter periplasmic adaptor subunit [Spirochaetales bacterium]|nr:efflux RND transporter periplasmic adaptor subunit [Spirochaetales bacterium]